MKPDPRLLIGVGKDHRIRFSVPEVFATGNYGDWLRVVNCRYDSNPGRHLHHRIKRLGCDLDHFPAQFKINGIVDINRLQREDADMSLDTDNER